MDNIILNRIEIQKKTTVYYYFEVTGKTKMFFRDFVLFYDFGEDVRNIPISILAIPFVGAFQSLTWLNNSILWIPEIDKTYYNSIKLVKLAFQEMHYDFPLRGKVVPAKLINNDLGISSINDQSILLFGGGVDAHCSFIRNKHNISSIMNVQGWFSNINELNRAALDDFMHCQEFANQHNIGFMKVRSNFGYIINSQKINKIYSKRLHESWWHGFQHSQAFISTAIVLAFKHSIPHIIIGSSNTIGDVVACASDITTDSMFAFAKSGDVIHDAFELNRQEKVKLIVDYQLLSKKKYPLKVCSFNDCNCCECEKCFRTILEIIAEGGDVRDFGFEITIPLKQFYQDVMNRNLALWGIAFEDKIYWKETKRRMKENYPNIQDKDFVDWFLAFDFFKAKRIGLFKYYRKNFFSILKRKFNP